MRLTLCVLLTLACLRPARAQDSLAPPEPATRQERQALLDQLLAQLRAAPTEPAASALEDRINQLWLQAGSPAVMLLMARGQRDLDAGAADDAREDFDSVIALDPSLPEAWNRRAAADFLLGDADSAIRDISEALAREPREFAALQSLSRIAEGRGDWKGALAAWRKVLEIDPKTPEGETRLKDLTRRALGDQT